MRNFIRLIVLAVPFLAGCASPTSLATAVRTDDMTIQEQNIAPTIPLLRPDGKITTLAEAAAPFYIVAFVEAPAGQPDYIDPNVEAIAKKFWLDSVSVVQITDPAMGKTFPDDVLQKSTAPKDNLILVLDPKRLAWEMFRMPAAGTLLLVDRFGYIVEVGSLSDSKNVLFETFQMAKEWERIQFNRSFTRDDSEY